MGKLITPKWVMEQYGVGRTLAERYLRESGLVLPRAKGGNIYADREEFVRYMTRRKK